MNPGQLPPGHVVGRWLVIAAIIVLVVVAIVWFLIARVASGDVEAWWWQFSYDQDKLFYSISHAWKFPWD